MRCHNPDRSALSDVPFPKARYVPGQTPRHPEDWFDTLKVDQATALDAGLAYFEAEFFWECHEVLEAVWMDTPDPSADRDMVQAVIQLANARLKLLMQRPNAALRLCDIVGELLDRIPLDAQPLGLDPDLWRAQLAQTRTVLG